MRVTIAGIKRSGSTAQYNMARLILQKYYYLTVYGQEYELTKGCSLIKHHPFDKELFSASDYVLTTDRPDEEIIESLDKFGSHNRYGLDMMRKHLQEWRSHNKNLHQEYSEILNNPKQCIKEIADFLELYEVDVNEIYKEFKQIKPTKEYDPITMLFPNHISK